MIILIKLISLQTTCALAQNVKQIVFCRQMFKVLPFIFVLIQVQQYVQRGLIGTFLTDNKHHEFFIHCSVLFTSTFRTDLLCCFTYSLYLPCFCSRVLFSFVRLKFSFLLLIYILSNLVCYSLIISVLLFFSSSIPALFYCILFCSALL